MVVVAFTKLNDGEATAGMLTVLDTTGAIGVPLGGVPTTEAVLTTAPASRSAWVTVWTAEQTALAPGASGAVGQVRPVTFASVTVMAVRVVLPVFCTVKV